MQTPSVRLFQPPPARNPWGRTGFDAGQDGADIIPDMAPETPGPLSCSAVAKHCLGMGWRKRMAFAK